MPIPEADFRLAPKRRPNAFFLGAAAAVWLVVLWGSGRSFDFTDEGVYYLAAVHPQEMPDHQTTYFLFGRILYALSGHNIIVIRALLAALVLAATAIFVRGLQRFLAAFAPMLDGGRWLSVTALAGSVLAFSTSPLGPSYNLFNAICLLAITGLVLQAASSAPVGRGAIAWAARGPLLAAGVLLTADFFIKFSTSVVLGAALAVFFLAASRERGGSKVRLVLLAVLLSLLTAGGYFFFIQDLAAWRKGIGGTLGAITHGSFLTGELTRYGNEWYTQVIETLWTYESVFTTLFLTAGLLLLFRWAPTRQRWFAIMGGTIAVYVGILAAPERLMQTSGRHGSRFHLAVICTLGLAAGLTWAVRAPGARPRLPDGAWRVLLALVLFALLPWVGAFGTNNDINDNTVYQLAPWLAIIAVFLAWLAQSWQAPWLLPAGALLVAAISFSQFVHGYIYHPYRVPGGRLAQVVPTAIGYPTPTRLRLDPATHDLIESVRDQLGSHGFKPGDDIFAFFNLPGLVFAVGGVSPGYPWYFAGDENSLALDLTRIGQVPPPRRLRAFLVLNGETGDFMARLRDLGIDFPNRYERCGPGLHNPVTGEDVEVWKPKNANP